MGAGLRGRGRPAPPLGDPPRAATGRAGVSGPERPRGGAGVATVPGGATARAAEGPRQPASEHAVSPLRAGSRTAARRHPAPRPGDFHHRGPGPEVPHRGGASQCRRARCGSPRLQGGASGVRPPYWSSTLRTRPAGGGLRSVARSPPRRVRGLRPARPRRLAGGRRPNNNGAHAFPEDFGCRFSKSTAADRSNRSRRGVQLSRQPTMGRLGRSIPRPIAVGFDSLPRTEVGFERCRRRC